MWIAALPQEKCGVAAAEGDLWARWMGHQQGAIVRPKLAHPALPGSPERDSQFNQWLESRPREAVALQPMGRSPHRGMILAEHTPPVTASR